MHDIAANAAFRSLLPSPVSRIAANCNHGCALFPRCAAPLKVSCSLLFTAPCSFCSCCRTSWMERQKAHRWRLAEAFVTALKSVSGYFGSSETALLQAICIPRESERPCEEALWPAPTAAPLPIPSPKADHKLALARPYSFPRGNRCRSVSTWDISSSSQWSNGVIPSGLKKTLQPSFLACSTFSVAE
jgi:hypothetical protein